MLYALIENNTVKNIIVAEATFIGQLQNSEAYILLGENDDSVGIGWAYAGGVFTPPIIESVDGFAITSITMRQLKLALLKINKLNAVASVIASLPSPSKEEVEIEWQYSLTVKRQGFIQILAPALDITEQQLDDLFLLGSTL